MMSKHLKYSYGAFFIVILISSVTIVGWLLNSLTIAGMIKNFVPMAPGTALFFFISGTCAYYQLKGVNQKNAVKIIIYCSIFLNLIILADNRLGYPYEIEKFLSDSQDSINGFPIGRMSPITIILFILSFISLLIIDSKKAKTLQFPIYLSTFGLGVAFIFDLGYLYGTPLLYSNHIIPLAVNTSVGFTFLFFGILAGFGLNERPISLFNGISIRARLLRNFLPATLIIIILAGWMDTFFIKYFNDHVLVSALTTITSLIVLGIILIRTSQKTGKDIELQMAYRKEAEDSLRESEIHFRTLADSGPALVWTSELDMKRNYFNKPWLNFTGKNINQQIGDKWRDDIYPDDMNQYMEIYEASFQQKKNYKVNYRLRFNDNSYHWIEENGTPRFNSSGLFIGYIGQSMDITEQKQATEALVKSEERYRLISSVANDYTFSTKVMPDNTLKSEWISGAFESISGYTLEEYMNKGGWRSIIHPDDLYIDDNDLLTLQNNQKINSELRTIHKNGTIVWVQVFALPIWDHSKNCLSGIYGAVKNITDQKKDEEKLINSELRFRELLEKVNLISIILDVNGNVTFSNNYALTLSKYKREEMIGKNWFDLMIPKENKEVKKIFTSGLKSGNITTRYENPIITKAGEKLDIVWTNVIQRNHRGEITGIAGIGEDITDRKLAEKKIIELNEDLESKVIERTKELEQKNTELARMNKLFVGRELRMIEIKNRNKELEELMKSQQLNISTEKKNT